MTEKDFKRKLGRLQSKAYDIQIGLQELITLIDTEQLGEK